MLHTCLQVVFPLEADTDGSKDPGSTFMRACKQIASNKECRTARDTHMAFQKVSYVDMYA